MRDFRPGLGPLPVIFVGSTRSPRSRHVRFTSNSDQIIASQRTVATCHSRHNAVQQISIVSAAF